MKKTTSKMDAIELSEIKQILKELSISSKETDRKFQETDRKFQETDRMIKNLSQELGGMGKSNGQITEDYFFSALDNAMQIGKHKFDYIDRNRNRKRKKLQAEYDIVLYNAHKVLIIEVKYVFRMKYFRKFYENLKNFKALNPEYKTYKIYGAIAFMTCEDGVIEEAENYGFYIITAKNDSFTILNHKSFEPNLIK